MLNMPVHVEEKSPFKLKIGLQSKSFQFLSRKKNTEKKVLISVNINFCKTFC